jgi:hypothetical protein
MGLEAPCRREVLGGLLFAGPLRALANPARRWRVARRGARHAVVSPGGEPTFLLGLNHVAEGAPEAPAERRAAFEVAAALLRRIGCVNLGYGAPPDLMDAFPFIADLRLHGASHANAPEVFRYADVFDPAFQERTRDAIEALCRRTADHPNLIGYYLTDTPRWDIALARIRRGDDWVSALRRLPPHAAGKRAYVAFLRERHGTPDRFTAAYGHAIRSFDDLLQTDFREFDRQNPTGIADDRAFLGRIAAELYRVSGEALARHAPGRLRFGERYKLHDHPPEILVEAARWVDVLSVQPGPAAGPLPGPGQDELEFDAVTFDRLHQATGKPILVCDHQMSFRTEAHPVTLWHQAADEAAAVASTGRFLRAALTRPYVIGYQRCQYRDAVRLDRGGLLKQGLVRSDGRPYEALVRGLADLHRSVTSTWRTAWAAAP